MATGGRRPTFVDPTMESTLEREGFVVLRGFVPPSTVEALAAGFAEVGPARDDPGRGFHVSFQSADPSYKAAVTSITVDALAPPTTAILDDHRAYAGAFLVKWPGVRSGRTLHQDFSIVDEEHYRSVLLWCPLNRTDETNGALHMIPGSHRSTPPPRVANAPFPFDDVADTLVERCAVPVVLDPGDVVLYDNAVAHFSYPNRSEAPRIAAAVGFVPAEAPLRHHHLRDDGRVEIIEIDDDFHIDHDVFDRADGPAGRVVDTIPLPEPRVDLAAIPGFHGRRRARLGRRARRRRAAEAAAAAEVPAWCDRCGRDGLPPSTRATSRYVAGDLGVLCEDCAR